MACYHPITGYRAKTPNASGKYSIVFNKNEGYIDREVTLPCGGCIGCRLEYSRGWAVRCMHETSLYENNIFITLTYEERHLPANGTLVKADFQKFMKRLRKRHGRGIRYFACGEYGEHGSRPHYHAIIFNFDFDDKYIWSRSNDLDVYRSEDLESLWPYGMSSIGTATFESAAYVARYVVKKRKGKDADTYYEKIDEKTGEVIVVEKEFALMSRNPGIGAGWLKKYYSDVYPGGYIVFNGMQMKVPKYYDNLAKKINEEALEKAKTKRRIYAKQDTVQFNSQPDRRRVREFIQAEKLKRLKGDI